MSLHIERWARSLKPGDTWWAELRSSGEPQFCKVLITRVDRRYIHYTLTREGDTQEMSPPLHHSVDAPSVWDKLDASARGEHWLNNVKRTESNEYRCFVYDAGTIPWAIPEGAKEHRRREYRRQQFMDQVLHALGNMYDDASLNKVAKACGLTWETAKSGADK